MEVFWTDLVRARTSRNQKYGRYPVLFTPDNIAQIEHPGPADPGTAMPRAGPFPSISLYPGRPYRAVHEPVMRPVSSPPLQLGQFGRPASFRQQPLPVAVHRGRALPAPGLQYRRQLDAAGDHVLGRPHPGAVS